jgi:hypothetical protein
MSRRQQQDSRESELMKRASRDPEVYKEMVKSMEEDPDLIKLFTTHLQRNIGEDKWKRMSLEQQNNLIKIVMEKNRIPVRKNGGKRIKSKTRRKTVKRTTRRKTVRRKKMRKRKSTTKRR